MAVSITVQEYLRRSNVAYMVVPHDAAFTAQEEAAVTHVPGRNWAKAVVCFADGEPLQAVVPADLAVNLDRLLLATGADTIRLAREDELDWLFPDCERGAMPPLGPLYHQRVFVDETLAEDGEIAFNGGSHSDAVLMRFDDFVQIAKPTLAKFAQQPMH